MLMVLHFIVNTLEDFVFNSVAANFNPFVLSEEELKDEGMSDWDDDVKMSEMVHFNETLPSVVATTSEAATEIAEKTLIN